MRLLGGSVDPLSRYFPASSRMPLASNRATLLSSAGIARVLRWLGPLISDAPDEMAGCEPHQGVKAAREVALIRKPQIQSNAGQRLFGALDQLPRASTS